MTTIIENQILFTYFRNNWCDLIFGKQLSIHQANIGLKAAVYGGHPELVQYAIDKGANAFDDAFKVCNSVKVYKILIEHVTRGKRVDDTIRCAIANDNLYLFMLLMEDFQYACHDVIHIIVEFITKNNIKVDCTKFFEVLPTAICVRTVELCKDNEEIVLMLYNAGHSRIFQIINALHELFFRS